MKIKKPTVMKAPGAGAATGGAAIAERFRLDNIEAEAASKAQRGTIGKGAAGAALVVGIVALALSAILLFVLFRHWEFLMPA